ncbi:MAG: hypothetical protein QXU46_00085 [Candidatus Bathyarchaeia archaeon]
MNVRTNVKAVSTLIIVILVIISAIIGGIISYAFTIAYYNRTAPAITITGIYINKENVTSFTISVLNPSYAPKDAKISRIAISLKEETQLYDVIETEPSTKNGMVIPIGESRNITCLKIKKDNANFTLGDFIGNFGFAGKIMVVHVFSSDFPATNMEVKLPYVKLSITEEFNSEYSFKKFNITLTNDPNSEVNVTIKDMLIGVDYSQVEPPIKGYVIPIKGSVRFNFAGNWHGLTKTNLVVYTEQGYNFRKEIETKSVHTAIQSVNFDIEHRDYFNVTIFNLPESAHYANITMIKCRLDDGTYTPDTLCDPPVGLIPNSTVTIRFDWDWTEYRGRNITVVAYFLQDFETTPYNVITPPPIIVKVLNEASIFDLKDTGHFNITIQNHVSSLESINITQIKVKKTGQILNGTTEVSPQLPNGPIAPGKGKMLNCTFDWAKYIKDYNDRNLTLTINVTTNTTPSKSYLFNFTFILPVVELNASVHFETDETRYINATIVIKNLEYSLWNLTLSEVILTVNASTGLLNYKYTFPEDEMINVGGDVVLLLALDKQKYSGGTLTLTVFTEELGEIKIPLSWLIP